jgi:hypothetical protein
MTTEMIETLAAEVADLPTLKTMTDAEMEAWIDQQRTDYHSGRIPSWKIKQIEQISGWTWGAPRIDLTNGGKCTIRVDLFPQSYRDDSPLGWTWVNTTIWIGTLIHGEAEEPDLDPISVLLGESSTFREREYLVRVLKAEARTLGYNYCTVLGDEGELLFDDALRRVKVSLSKP